MEIIDDIPTIKSKVKSYRSNNLSVGLVPTMGALHKGHLSLIRKSLEENDITCCSIYVNPTQFNNTQDLKKYPRPIEDDIQLLKETGCHVVFLPKDEEIYPSLPSIKIDFGNLGTVMEGKFRPGHFNGVGIIVSKLFNIIQPNAAYFGQKDLQQYLIIKQMVTDLSFDLELKSVPIERDTDGLALSSRNIRLNVEQRALAPKLYEALLIAREELLNGNSIETAKQKVINHLKPYPSIQLEYFEVADAEELSTLTHIDSKKPTALCIAAFIGDVRLIDNLLLFS
jgi:pantoate--beta-alanine ligase